VIVYADSSVLVKRYLREAGSDQVRKLLADGATVATGLITRAEVAAALGKAVRVGNLTRAEAEPTLRQFRSQWPFLQRLRITEAVVARADELAWQHGLRGYDAVHLAAAVIWQTGLDRSATLATYDHQLWRAAQNEGFAVWPEALAD